MLSRSNTFTVLKCFDSTLAVDSPDMPLPNTTATPSGTAAWASATAWVSMRGSIKLQLFTFGLGSVSCLSARGCCLPAEHDGDLVIDFIVDVRRARTSGALMWPLAHQRRRTHACQDVLMLGTLGIRGLMFDQMPDTRGTVYKGHQNIHTPTEHLECLLDS